MREQARTRTRVQALVSGLGPGPWPLEAVLVEGWTYGEIRHAVKAGRLRRPHRGVLAPGRTAGGNDAWERVRAAVLRAGATAVVSHESAALIHELWMPPGASGLVHLTDPGVADRTDHGMRLHGSGLPDDFVVVVRDVRVTTVARTAVDVARGRSLPHALMVLDSASRALACTVGDVTGRRLRDPDLRARLTVVAEAQIRRALASELGWPGTAVVRRALRHVDLGSESPWESLSRGWMVESDVPLPCVGYAVMGASGTVYVADFAWPERRVLGEADGTSKYGVDPAEVRSSLRAERRRQRDLEDAGWSVVRWDSTEPRAAVLVRIRRALLGVPRTSLP